MTVVYPGERTRFAILATLAIVFWLALIVGTMGIALLYIGLFLILYLFAHSGLISYLRGNAVRIGPEQFPDLHARIEGCCRKLGLERVPDAYLLHSEGLFNALATRFLGRNYIVLFSTVLDALEKQPGAINFYIGHEAGHIKRNHLTWNPILAPVAWLPLIGAALRRAEEYTCDRHGLACCETMQDAEAGVAALAAGQTRWPSLSLPAFRAQMQDSSGFWMSYHELTNDYPWLCKRMHAIDELSQQREPKPPMRNPLAYIFALLTPRLPASRAGGLGSVMITVAIIGILAAIAIPAYQDYVTRAAVTNGIMQAQPIKQAVQGYAEEKRKWPTSLEEIGVESSHLTVGQNVTAEVSLGDGGEIHLTFNGGALKGQTVDLVPKGQVDGDKVSVTWTCSSADAPPKFLPMDCRR